MERDIRVLEVELEKERRKIKTVIKAKGLKHPNLNGKTFASFHTDHRHHLLSFVSKLSPSPDWMVGVSMMEMCQTNCTWMNRQDILLYPWDIGVDSGVTYQSEGSPTTPLQAVQRITSQHPQDENSPFYRPEGGPVEPLARVVIRKLRVGRRRRLWKKVKHHS